MRKLLAIAIVVTVALTVLTPFGKKVLGKAAEVAFRVGVGEGN